MKVCMITGSFPRMVCGVGDYTAQLCRSLSKFGVEVVVITSKDPQIESNSTLQNEALKVLPAIKGWVWLDLFKLYSMLKIIEPDIIHIQYQTSIYNKRSMVVFLPFFIRILLPYIKIVTTFHDLEGPKPFPGSHRLKLSRLLLLFPLLFCHKSIICGEPYKKKLASFLPVKKKIDVIPIGPGLPCNLFRNLNREEVRSQIGVKSEETLLSSFGFVEGSRDFKNLLFTLNILLRKGIEAKLILIGGKSKTVYGFTNYSEGLRDHAMELGILERIVFTGYCDSEEVSKYILCSDMSVLPFTEPDYLYRSTSFPLLLSHGRAVIITGGKDMPEWLIDGHNVIFVRTHAPSNWAEAIENLIRRKALCKEIGKNARNLFLQRYSWDHIGSEIIGLYKELNGKV